MTSLWVTDQAEKGSAVCFHCDGVITVTNDIYPEECLHCHSHMSGVMERPSNIVRLLRSAETVVLEERNKPVPELPGDDAGFGRNAEFGDTGLGSTLRGNE